jgi:CBS domain-containing protein
MSPRSISGHVLRDAEAVPSGASVETAVRAVHDSGLPALPVVDDRGHYAGIFGEREFMSALFPGYVSELKSAAFLSRSLDDALEKRETCRMEPVDRYMNTEHVEVGPDFGDTQVAETFLHHRVLLVPVVDDGRLIGVVTRRDFFRALAERFLTED